MKFTFFFITSIAAAAVFPKNPLPETPCQALGSGGLFPSTQVANLSYSDITSITHQNGEFPTTDASEPITFEIFSSSGLLKGEVNDIRVHVANWSSKPRTVLVGSLLVDGKVSGMRAFQIPATQTQERAGHLYTCISVSKGDFTTKNAASWVIALVDA